MSDFGDTVPDSPLCESGSAAISAEACLITQTVMGMNWRAYGLNQVRGQLPRGAVTLIVHLASVWVPFTSESKEAIASYPDIQKELRLGLQAVGRKLGMYMKRREKVKHEGERRSIFLRYLGEEATAVSGVNGMDRKELFDALVFSVKRKTATADGRGRFWGERDHRGVNSAVHRVQDVLLIDELTYTIDTSTIQDSECFKGSSAKDVFKRITIMRAKQAMLDMVFIDRSGSTHGRISLLGSTASIRSRGSGSCAPG